ncbi:MAG: glycosyltransferase [Parasporobacterium sp.]|nr:glycosyltransferase [Parasporobacterium sp.]
MTDNEMISVIIPVYNVEKYLNKCIRSVVEQTYKNLEIILVDDGSPDQCGAICDKWAERDERIRVIHKANGGLSDARNAGLDAATGAYVGFVDSDDYIHPEMYRRLYEKIKEYGADLAICGFERVDEESDKVIGSVNMPVKDLVDKKDAILYVCRKGPFIIVWNKLYKRELFSNIRFPYGKFGEDLFVMPWIYYRCDSIASVSENLYYYVLTLNSISRRDYTVWHLDSVEAYYNMMQFCQNNGFPDLLEKISAKMTDSYIVNIERIKRILPKDKQRVREIRKMVLYGIFKYGKDVRLVHKLYIVSPHIYHFLLRAKRKLFMFLQ